MSTVHDLIPGQTDLAVNDNTEGDFHLDLCIAGNQGSKTDADTPLPRPKRRCRPAEAGRGMPPDGELADVARARRTEPPGGEPAEPPQADNKKADPPARVPTTRNVFRGSLQPPLMGAMHTPYASS